MRFKRLLALLAAAALALSLLAGCGGKNQSLGQVILDLLDGQYANVTVEIDPDLEGDLRQAVHEGETDAEIRAALEKILGNGVSFRLIGDGQQGDTAWNLILYPGSDPDAAARSAFTEWSKVFGSLPRDGQYSAGLAMIETENGYAILVQATVDKAASRDDDDDDDDDDEPEKPYSVEIEDGTLKSVTVNTSNGLENLFAKQEDEAQEITDARDSGFEGVTIKLAAGKTYTVSQTFDENNGVFLGTLKGESKETTIIKLTGGNGLFQQIDSKGTVENITFNVQTTITNTYADGGSNCLAGAVAGVNNGTISGCTVTIDTSGRISATGGSFTNAGGLVGLNYGTITNCTVIINGSISATSDSVANAGGIAGDNEGAGEIKGNSQVTIESSGSIQATTDTSFSVRASAGGLAGQNTGTVDGTYKDNGGTITAKVGSNEASVPDSDNSDKDDNLNTDTQGEALAGTKIGFDWRAGGPVG